MVPFGDVQLSACTLGGRLPELSLEDALEVFLHVRAKADHGATLFVTADGGILRYGEAVHPDLVATNYRHLLE